MPTFSCISLEKWQEHAKVNGTIANIMGLKRAYVAEGANVDVSKIIINDVFFES